MILLLCALLVSAATAGADVYFEEEVVNRGFGKDKTGARKTTNKIYIKGKSQRVEQLIEADAKMAKALRRQGQSLNTSTILRLDQAQVYEIDLTAQTFVQEKTPPARKAAAKPEAAPGGPQRALAVKVPEKQSASLAFPVGGSSRRCAPAISTQKPKSSAAKTATRTMPALPRIFPVSGRSQRLWPCRTPARPIRR